MHSFKAVAISAALGLAVSSGVLAPVQAQALPQAGVVVLPFAVSGHADQAAPSFRACVPSQDPQALDAAAASELPAKLAAAVADQLGAQSGLRVYAGPREAPAGTPIVAGCIQRADAGNAAKRLVGMGMGASVIAAHVQVYRGDQLVREFDAEVTGANKLPPIGPVGLAVHGVRGLHATLGADDAKLAKKIAAQVTAG